MFLNLLWLRLILFIFVVLQKCFWDEAFPVNILKNNFDYTKEYKHFLSLLGFYELLTYT